MSLDVNSSIKISSIRLFGTSLSQTQSPVGTGPKSQTHLPLSHDIPSLQGLKSNLYTETYHILRLLHVVLLYHSHKVDRNLPHCEAPLCSVIVPFTQGTQKLTTL